jgi:hypothetical protein
VYWEVEELIRKLLLTAVAVLMDAGSPLQVRCPYVSLSPHAAAAAAAAAAGLPVTTHVTPASMTRVVPCVPQVTLAIVISGWAHVVHATFKPWGAGTLTYVPTKCPSPCVCHAHQTFETLSEDYRCTPMA